MFNNEGYSLSDIAAVTKNGDGMFGNDNGGAWWIILLFILLCGGYGNRGGLFGGCNSTGSGITDGYILTSDFASLERQMGNGFDRLSSQTTQLANGVSSLGYDQLNQMNNINSNINQSTNNIVAGLTQLGNQMASCCCEQKTIAMQNSADLNYRLAEQSCATRQAVNDAARDITANADCNTRSILSAIQDIQTQNLQDKIAALSADNQSLRFAASQQAQNAFLLSRLSPSPAPAYIVPNPYTGNYGYNTYCGCCST